MQEGEEPATPPPAAAPAPTPPPAMEEPKPEFDITKCARQPLLNAYCSRALSGAASGVAKGEAGAACMEEQLARGCAMPDERRCCSSVRSYSITITLAVVFVLAKAAGYFGLIDSN